MYSILLITLLLKSYIINCAYSQSPENKVLETEPKTRHNLEINEFDKLTMKILNLENNLNENYPCTGSCDVGNNKVQLTCRPLRGQDQKQYIEVTIDTNITKEYDGIWKCTYNVYTTIYITQENQQTNNSELEHVEQTQAIALGNSLALKVIPQPEPANKLPWIYIGAGIGTLVILVIIGQTICIIHFKKKAAAVQREVRLSSRPEDRIEDRTRYGETPVKAEIAIEARESRIYEAMDFTVPPEPPSLQSLPRKQKKPETTIVARDSDVIPFTNISLKKAQQINKMDDLTKLDTGSHKPEGIRNRPPLPLPTEEVYQALEEDSSSEPTPKPKRKGFKKATKNIFAKKHPVLVDPEVFSNEETPAVPQSKPIGPAADDFKKALEMRLRQNTMSQNTPEPIKPKPVSKLPTQTPTRDMALSPKPWTNEQQRKPRTKPQAPQGNPWSQSPKPKQKRLPPIPVTEEPKMPKHQQTNNWTPEPQTPYVSANWSGSIEGRPKPRFPGQPPLAEKGAAMLRFGANPGLPPQDAPPSKERRPPPPLKPQPLQPPHPQAHPQPPLHPHPHPQLHPQSHPHPQLHMQPQPHVLVPAKAGNRNSYDSEEEEWTYEDLQNFNLYSI